MTFAKREFQQTLFLRVVYRALLCLCILVGISFWLAQVRVNNGNGFLRPLKSAGGQFSWANNRDAQGTESIPGRDQMGAGGWSMELVTSAVRRLLLGKIEHSMIVGIINEDGSLNTEFISAGKFIDEDEKWEEEEDIYAGKVFNSLEAGRHGQKPDAPVKTFHFEMCPPKMRDYIPCLDDVAAIKQLPDAAKGEKWERHCPHRGTQMCCIIATPARYKTPIRWPRSKDEVWMANVQRPRQVLNENWITIQKDKFRFPTAGVLFPEGVDSYLGQLAQMVPNLAFGVRTRTALDVGCGVASFGAALLAHGVLPLSIAAKDGGRNEVQFALERGVPAMVAVLSSHRLLYPSQAFDLIHCSDCEIEWTRDGGISLVEVNRLLRAGGYFVWAAPLRFRQDEKDKLTWDATEDLASRLCWTLVAKEGYLAIWQKPYENSCYQNRAPGILPPICDESDDPDAVWYVALKWCISSLPTNITNGKLSDWPARLSLIPERLGISLKGAEVARPDVFLAKQRHWNEIVSGYLRGLGLKKENVRNVMDMRAGYGGFAAALVEQHVDWWVMNVVPTHGPNSLAVIYDRGLLGVVHDWCEPFDTYPRTYDLLHAVGLFSLEETRCNIGHIILEMDRILRPGGWVLVRESKAMAVKVEALAKSVRWKTRILETESGPYGKDKLLSCIKHKK